MLSDHMPMNKKTEINQNDWNINHISIITLNVNGLKSSIKRHIDWQTGFFLKKGEQYVVFKRLVS